MTIQWLGDDTLLLYNGWCPSSNARVQHDHPTPKYDRALAQLVDGWLIITQS